MNSNLSKGYLCVSECNKIKWNSNSALQILILNCYPLHHPHIAVVWEGSAKKVILVPVITGAKKIKKIKLKKNVEKEAPLILDYVLEMKPLQQICLLRTAPTSNVLLK